MSRNIRVLCVYLLKGMRNLMIVRLLIVHCTLCGAYPLYRLRRGIMKQETVQPTSSGTSVTVALCITGNERAVLRPVVRESASKYIIQPVEERGGAVDVFLVIGVGFGGHHEPLRPANAVVS